MAKPQKILLLAGSAEARQIAVALRERGHAVQAVMSEPPRGPNPMPVPFEICADITPEHLSRLMAQVDCVIDASHGFDGLLTQAGHAAACALERPFIIYARPGWTAPEGAQWTYVADVASAMPLIGPGERVFSATGWASLPDYAKFPGACLMLRQTSHHRRKPPFDFVELVFGTPPFQLADEIALFQEHRVDVLILRNLGGDPSRPKLDAAQELGLKVILIDRPPLPKDAQVTNQVTSVLDWVAAL